MNHLINISTLEAPLNFEKATKYLQISRATLTKLLKEKKIRCHNLTKKIIFYKSEMFEHMQKIEYKPN